jgi:hypothetical protein
MIIDFIKRLIRGFKWFKRGYNTYEWDYQPLIEIMRFKLQDMLDFWSNPNNIRIIETSRLRNVKNLKICVHLLTRIIDDEYTSKTLESVEKKWGEPQIKDRQKAYAKADKIKQHDQYLFFKIFSKQYERWWD